MSIYARYYIYLSQVSKTVLLFQGFLHSNDSNNSNHFFIMGLRCFARCVPLARYRHQRHANLCIYVAEQRFFSNERRDVCDKMGPNYDEK